jgi:arylsulfatase A-like enzyme
MNVSVRYVTVLSLVVAGLATPRQPHLLFIVADDYGWNDVGYHQNAISSANPKGLPTTNNAAGVMRTPTLDSLSKEGARLDMYYVQPLCSPTRATFMTGRYASHTGIGPDVIVGSSPYGLPKREVLLPQLLRDAGYATHMVGKWHLGFCHEGYMPSSRGFDTFMGYLEGAKGYSNHAGERNGTGGHPACMSGPTNEYSSKLYADEAARIVRSHDAAKPLFLYLAFQSVHGPYDIPPKSMVDVDKVYPEIVDEKRRVYAGMVQLLDTAVSEVVEAYKSAGLWEDTVLVFSTDNGGIGPGSNYPLRGSKVHDWEGGIRGVAFVRGTDSSLAPVPRGIVVDELMHSTDWLPTFCGLAGTYASGTLPLDGVNQWATIAQGQPSGRDVIMHNVPAKNHAVKSKGCPPPIALHQTKNVIASVTLGVRCGRVTISCCGQVMAIPPIPLLAQGRV